MLRFQKAKDKGYRPKVVDRYPRKEIKEFISMEAMYICPLCCGLGKVYNIFREPTEYVCKLCKGSKFIGGDVYYTCVLKGKTHKVVKDEDGILTIDVNEGEQCSIL